VAVGQTRELIGGRKRARNRYQGGEQDESQGTPPSVVSNK
jgi:hypothetical protein